MQSKLKEEKQKVTLYLPHALHKQLKVKAAVDSETMTDLAQKAIVFYLSNAELVEQYSEGYGQTHRVYSCPECSTHLAIKKGEMVAVAEQANMVIEESLSSSVEAVPSLKIDSQGEGELVPC